MVYITLRKVISPYHFCPCSIRIGTVFDGSKLNKPVHLCCLQKMFGEEKGGEEVKEI